MSTLDSTALAERLKIGPAARLRDGANLNYEMKREITEVSASDSNRVTIITDLLVESEFGRFDAWCVLKLIYTDRSIAAIFLRHELARKIG